MQPLTIIGTGLAGYSLAREFRRLDKDAPLRLISRDDGANYSKPMLSGALSLGKQAEQLVQAEASAMAQTLNAEILTHAEVESLDSARRQFVVDGKTFPYSRLVLAVGAQPFRPPLAGDAAAAVLSVNNLADYRRFRSRLETAQRVAIIGPGLIGCEFANDLLNAGREVAVIGPDAYPLSSLLPEAVGQSLQNALAEAGVEWHLQTQVAAVDGGAGDYRLQLADGTELSADLVLSAVGLRPDLRLAQQAGLAVNRGIVTDAYLQTSAEGIYALGDCAEVEGRNLPYVMPLMQGAKALANTLSGTPTEVKYPAMPVMVKTPAHPLAILPPPRDAEGEWQIDAADGVRATYVNATEELLGFALSGARVAEKGALLKRLRG